MVSQSNGRRSLLLYSGMLFVLSSPGCLATRGWVTDQLAPLDGRLSQAETRLGQDEARIGNVEARTGTALDRLDHMRLERKLTLNLKEGTNFARNSAALTADTRRQIDGFLSDLGPADDKVFLVTGHTDSMGPGGYNYELGQERAGSVAQYLITQKGVDPLHVTTMSYGENAPVADNATRTGRNKNRRVEILVYKEAITSSIAPQDKVAAR